MQLEDVTYFAVKKYQHPALFEFVKAVVVDSVSDDSDRLEIQRRLRLLNRSQGNEHIRQASNFIAEVAAFHSEQVMAMPHWVPELANRKMPDIEVGGYPIEVKHLNSPRDEHEALANGDVYGGSVDKDYDVKLSKKIVEYITDARRKFVSYNELKNNTPKQEGTLYLFFTKSIDAGLVDTIPWATKMEDRVREIAYSQLTNGDTIKLIIRDIDSILDFQY